MLGLQNLYAPVRSRPAPPNFKRFANKFNNLSAIAGEDTYVLWNQLLEYTENAVLDKSGGTCTPKSTK